MNRQFLWIAVLALLGLMNANHAQADDSLSIPCKDDSGAVVNAKKEEVCESILPKCSDLRKTMIESMKDMISWKIYGYYHLNKDIELNQQKVTNPNQLKGKDLPYPVCSVVGHKVSGNEKGEIEKQSVGKGLSCGEFPRIEHGNKWTYRSSVIYEGNRGQRWFSWVQGALPWELRRSAYDIDKELKSDLSNLGAVLSSSAMSDQVKKQILAIRENVIKLSGAAKIACHSSSQNIIQDCQTPGKLTLLDPVNRVCTLAKAQLALNEVAVPNMLVFETMERTKKLHDSYFKDIFIGTQGEFGKLVGHCADNRQMVGILASLLDFWPFEDIFQWLKANKSYSCFTSCMLDGKSYYTAIDDGQHESCPSQICGGKKRRQCSKMSRFSITSGKPYNALFQTVIESESQSNEETDDWGISFIKWYISKTGGIDKIINESNPTHNTGFAAMVEKIIRKDICGQTKSKSEDNPCDQINIPDTPKNLTTNQASGG